MGASISERTEWVKFSTAVIALLFLAGGFLISKLISEPTLKKENERLIQQVQELKNERTRQDERIQRGEESRQRHTSELATKDEAIASLTRQILGLNGELENARQREAAAISRGDRAESEAERGIAFVGEAAKKLNRVEVLLADSIEFIRSESAELAPIRQELEQLSGVEAQFDQSLRMVERTTDDPLAGVVAKGLSFWMRDANQPMRNAAEQKYRQIEASSAVKKLKALEIRLNEMKSMVRQDL